MIVRLILSALLGASPLVKAAPPKAPRAEPPPAPTAPIDRMPLCFDAAVRSMLLEEHATFQTREHVEAGYAAARWHGVDPSLLLAVGYVESRLRPLHGDSGRACGAWQFHVRFWSPVVRGQMSRADACSLILARPFLAANIAAAHLARIEAGDGRICHYNQGHTCVPGETYTARVLRVRNRLSEECPE